MDRRKHVSNLITLLMLDAPILGYIVKSMRIEYDRSLEQRAYTDGKKIVVGKRFFELSNSEQAYVLAHEAMHIVRRDCMRVAKIVKALSHKVLNPETVVKIYNIISDGKINGLLDKSSSVLKPPEDRIREEDLAEIHKEHKKLSTEELTLYTFRRLPKISLRTIMSSKIEIDITPMPGGRESGGRDTAVSKASGEKGKKETSDKKGGGGKRELGKEGEGTHRDEGGKRGKKR